MVRKKNVINKCNTYIIYILRLSTLAKMTNPNPIWFSNAKTKGFISNLKFANFKMQ